MSSNQLMDAVAAVDDRPDAAQPTTSGFVEVSERSLPPVRLEWYEGLTVGDCLRSCGIRIPLGGHALLNGLPVGKRDVVGSAPATIVVVPKIRLG